MHYSGFKVPSSGINLPYVYAQKNVPQKVWHKTWKSVRFKIPDNYWVDEIIALQRKSIQ